MSDSDRVRQQPPDSDRSSIDHAAVQARVAADLIERGDQTGARHGLAEAWAVLGFDEPLPRAASAHRARADGGYELERYDCGAYECTQIRRGGVVVSVTAPADADARAIDAASLVAAHHATEGQR